MIREMSILTLSITNNYNWTNKLVKNAKNYYDTIMICGSL